MGLVLSWFQGTPVKRTIFCGIFSLSRGFIEISWGGTLMTSDSPKAEEEVLSSELNDGEVNRRKEVHHHEAGPFLFGTGVFIFGVVMVVVSALLLAGVGTKTAEYLKPWIICQFVELCFAAAFIIYYLALGNFWVTLLGPLCALLIYFYIVVISYYTFLLEPQNTQVPTDVQLAETSVHAASSPKEPSYYTRLEEPRLSVTENQGITTTTYNNPGYSSATTEFIPSGNHTKPVTETSTESSATTFFLGE